MSILFSPFFQKINTIRPENDEFLQRLTTIALTPKILYYNGTLPKNVVYDEEKGPERPKTVAIVGTRKNTPYGKEVAYKLAFELAKRGVVIVSGLAFGIDSVAHRAALDAGGLTVAVLGNPIGEIQPQRHESLAREILEKSGAILSEYPKNAALDYRLTFLERNRLISGLADVVVVVEAAERSGSLNTAMHAIEQGRDLFAVPGNITSSLSQGCNKLIKQGAMPYTEVEDVMDLLFPPKKRRKSAKNAQTELLFGDTPEETAILRAISEGETDGERLAALANLTIPEFNQTISLLEIKGRVFPEGLNRWCLK
ncbi:DNA-processing protein DprA [Candidatus Saccharibacteria bacterium]|nr:DNA-processing protein DprA [Candidatus Saccharibacteria bacterium]